MANNVLNPTEILRESQRLLHQKLNFCGNIMRGYDGRFANDGAKIGNQLDLRLPIMYSTGTGATMATGTGADTLESRVTLTVNSQRYVPMRFTSNEMTMKIDEFSDRHLKPAMTKLAAMVENDLLSTLYPKIPNVVHAGTAVNFADVMAGRVKIGNFLAPHEDRTALLDLQANVDLVGELKTLFEAREQIKKQYLEGRMGNAAGFDFYENTLLPTHTTGAEGGGSAYLCNATAAQVGSYTSPNTMSLIVDTGTKTVKKGDTFTIASVYRVHPESKANTNEAMQFTVLADFAGAGTISISPAIIASGPYKNCSAGAANNAKLTFGGAASTTYKQSLLFQKGFAVMGSADLILPKGVHMAAREVFDGISMRLVQNYDIVKDRMYTRIDVLYGFKAIRPQLACRVLHT